MAENAYFVVSNIDYCQKGDRNPPWDVNYPAEHSRVKSRRGRKGKAILDRWPVFIYFAACLVSTIHSGNSMLSEIILVFGDPRSFEADLDENLGTGISAPLHGPSEQTMQVDYQDSKCAKLRNIFVVYCGGLWFSTLFFFG